jgi:hypothetical protein
MNAQRDLEIAVECLKRILADESLDSAAKIRVIVKMTLNKIDGYNRD